MLSTAEVQHCSCHQGLAHLSAAVLPTCARVSAGHRRKRYVQASRGSQSAGLIGTQDKQQQQAQPAPYSYLLPRQAVALFAAGAALGPFCDGLHSQHDVLHYVNPTISVQLEALHWSFETCWWVPLLFGVAGLILGMSVPVLDELASRKLSPTAATAARPSQTQAAADGSVPTKAAVQMSMQEASWPWVLLCISLFVAQYWLSGVLEQPLLGQTLGSSSVPTLDTVLLAYALLHWYVFDRTLPGFGMSALTAVCGPVVEIGLINLLCLYHYTHPVWFGAVPTWIPWVYFCGGPAVGNLGRLVWQTLKGQYVRDSKQQ